MKAQTVMRQIVILVKNGRIAVISSIDAEVLFKPQQMLRIIEYGPPIRVTHRDIRFSINSRFMVRVACL